MCYNAKEKQNRSLINSGGHMSGFKLKSEYKPTGDQPEVEIRKRAERLLIQTYCKVRN